MQTQIRSDITGVESLSRYVDEVLNGACVDPLNELFTPAYRDHHPLRIPGLLEPRENRGTFDDLKKLVALLASPLINLAFALEEVIPGKDRVAYRLFGEGTIRLSTEPLTMRVGRNSSGPVRTLDLPGVKLRVKASGWDSGKILGDSLMVIYSCVGIFELSGSRFSARWGPEVIE
jgi:hypothetical protein